MSEPDEPAEEGPPKPEPPERPDFDSIEQRVREKASRIRRKPGESILIPNLSASRNITASELCPRYEQEHRGNTKLETGEVLTPVQFHFLSRVFSKHGEI